MFLRAGFNHRHRNLGIHALVARTGRRWVRSARLIRFACGDYAWAGEHGVSWPECVVFVDKIFSPVWAYDLPRSELPQ